MKIILNINEILDITLNDKNRANVVYYKTDINPLFGGNKTYKGEFVYPNFVEFLTFFGCEYKFKEIEEYFKTNAHYISVCKNSDGDTFFVLKEMFSNRVLGVYGCINQLIDVILANKENELTL